MNAIINFFSPSIILMFSSSNFDKIFRFASLPLSESPIFLPILEFDHPIHRFPIAIRRLEIRVVPARLLFRASNERLRLVLLPGKVVQIRTRFQIFLLSFVLLFRIEFVFCELDQFFLRLVQIPEMKQKRFLKLKFSANYKKSVSLNNNLLIIVIIV